MQEHSSFEREITCCFTGHRKLSALQTEKVYQNTVAIIEQLAKQGYKNFCCGGALGYDTLAAKAVLALREEYSIKLMLILPCINQDAYWQEKDRLAYKDILSVADNIIYTDELYNRGSMFKRNRRLVDLSSVCVCCCMKAKGGTAYTVDYARKNGLKIINVISDGEEIV